nr:hypothetical protein [uncultured Desulfobacter sp.]
MRTDKEFAEMIGLKPKAFHARKQSGSIPYPEIIDLANRYKLDLNWVFNGESCKETEVPEELSPPQMMSKKENVIVIKHQDLVSRFKDPEKGIENNAHLLTIEEASEQLYKKVSEYLKTTSEAAKIIKSEIAGQKKAKETGWKDSDGKNIDSA